MSMPELSLRTRFIGACLLLVTISTAGYFVAVAQFVEFLESELHSLRLGGELQEFADSYAVSTDAVGPHAAGLSSYVVPAGAPDDGIPERLRRMGPGIHDDIHLNDREVAVGRQDVNGARLYVVLDMEPVEQLEARFITLAWLCVLLSWAAAIILALWLARRVMQPVTRLAHLVANWQPDNHEQRLTPQFGEREIGVIAAAFDRFMERLREFVAREQAFTEDASHELRTPLAVIDSSVQLLLDDAALPAQSRGRVQRIQRAVQQMQMLIEALLFLARESGGYPAEHLALHQLVAEVADSHRELLAGKSLDLTVKTTPTVVRAPRGMASCVVGNLLLNAIHYTDRGRIEIEVHPEGLTVQDTGSGIPPDDLSRVFERRFRGAQSRGLGLGLYLVKRICDRLGWQVKVSSAAGVGTRFEVSFTAVS